MYGCVVAIRRTATGGTIRGNPICRHALETHLADVGSAHSMFTYCRFVRLLHDGQFGFCQARAKQSALTHFAHEADKRSRSLASRLSSIRVQALEASWEGGDLMPKFGIGRVEPSVLRKTLVAGGQESLRAHCTRNGWG